MWVGSLGLCMRLGETGGSGHAVNPSMEARWRHPWRHTVPIRRSPQGAERFLRAVGRSKGESRSKRKSELKWGDEGEAGRPLRGLGLAAALMCWTGSGALGAAQRATRFFFLYPTTRFRFCFSLVLFPSVPRPLSGHWATGLSGPWGAMDGATEPHGRVYGVSRQAGSPRTPHNPSEPAHIEGQPSQRRQRTKTKAAARPQKHPPRLGRSAKNRQVSAPARQGYPLVS